MELLSNAVQAVQRNLKTLFLYVFTITVASAIAQAVAYIFGGLPENSSQSLQTLGLQIALDLSLIVVASAAQSIAFSRMGKEIDRPLWKISGDVDALKRFFLLWFVPNFAIGFLYELYLLFADMEDFGRMLLLMSCAINAIYIPICACIMFRGRVDRRQVGEHLSPLYRQSSAAFAVILLSVANVALFRSLVDQAQAQPWMFPIINIVASYFECVVFAATWLLCMHDRMHPEEVELDF